MTAKLSQALSNYIDSIQGETRALRRELHQNPELGLEEFRTTERLLGALSSCSAKPRELESKRGFWIDLGQGTDRVALRADIDALPIQDKKNNEYASVVPSVMHACGHDAHAAMLVAAVRALDACQELLPKGVSLRAIFQPAEELGKGAEEMIAAGALEGVSQIIAQHVFPGIPLGQIGVRDGALCARATEVCVEVQGRGGHAARPHETIDPIAASVQFLSTVYQQLPRANDARNACVVSFGKIAGGNYGSAIPDTVELRGTIRCLSVAAFEQITAQLSTIARGTALSTGTEIVISYGTTFEAVQNDPQVMDVVRATAAEFVGPNDILELDLPSMGAEDFGAYLRQVPGAMFRLGISSEQCPAQALHTSCFDIDERCLTLGAKIMALSAVHLALARHSQ